MGATPTAQATSTLTRPAALWCELGDWQGTPTDPALRPPPFSRPLPRPEVRSGPSVELQVLRAQAQILDGPATPVLAYDGQFPGPTIHARVGQELSLRLHAGEEEDAVLHLHGAHVPAVHDGHVNDVVPVGGSRTYTYANSQPAATLWYHDHLLMRTGPRVYSGLSGAYLLLDPGEVDLGLPVGDERDVELLITDRTFADDGSLVYDGGPGRPAVGDVVLVNGADRPRLDVAAGLVRLRLANVCNARGLRVGRADGMPLMQVATDGGLLGAPVDRASIELWPAERAEVLLDLSGADVGTRVVLADTAGGGNLLAIDVVDAPGGGAAPDVRLPPLADLPPPEVVRTITLDADGPRFLLAGHGFDPDVRDVYARLGAVERWQLVNTTSSSHPMHLHLVSFLVRSRSTSSGGPLALRPEDEGWKDTVLVRPFETVAVDARFADHEGDFMYHCHVLEHEDHDMMSQFRVVDLARVAGRTRVETAAAIVAGLPDPVGLVVVADGEDWRSALAGAALADALLLVSGTTLDPTVRDELVRRPPAQVVVVGDAVTEEVVDALAQLAPTRRVAAADPVATAAAVALDLAGQASTAVLATDRVFADALAAGLLGLPVLLTDPEVLSDAAADALQQLGVTQVVVAGGTAAVSPAVEASLVDAGLAVIRVAGADRTATAAAFTRRAGLDPTVWAASADRFPDALGAAVAARRTGGTLVLVGDSGVSSATAGVLIDAATRRIRIAGGEAAVTLVAEAALAAHIQLPPG